VNGVYKPTNITWDTTLRRKHRADMVIRILIFSVRVTSLREGYPKNMIGHMFISLVKGQDAHFGSAMFKKATLLQILDPVLELMQYL
jgi:hypothetical protein